MKRVIFLLIAILLVLPFAAEAGKGKNKPKDRNRNQNQHQNEEKLGCNLTTYLRELAEESLTADEKQELLYMREEEKVARDVYLSLHEEWGLPIFRKISRSERTHMKLALTLINKYGLEDPVGDNGLGIFTDTALQALYEDLVAAGLGSIESALLVGAAIEDVDIYDLQQAYAQTDNEDLQVLYQNLMKGARNHLRAFVKVLDRHGVTYEPEYLSQGEFDEIISSKNEKGVVDADGELICGGGKGRN